MKIRINLRPRIPLENFMMAMALFFVASFALLEHASISVPYFSLLKFPLLYAGGFFMLPYIFRIISSLRKKKFFYLLLMTLLLFAFIGLSGHFNKGTVFGSSDMNRDSRFMLFWAELFLLTVWVAETGRGDFAVRFLFWYVLILAVVTDMLLLTRLMVFYSSGYETYLVGTKFIVAYLHMDLLALWFVKNNGRFLFWQKSKAVMILLCCVVIMVSLYIDCLTGLLGCIVLMWLFATMDKPMHKKLLKLNSPWLMALALTVSVLFPFVSQAIVSIPGVQTFLEEVLGRSSTLTGRTDIFGVFAREMEGNWLWGYGFGNGYTIAKTIFGYANAQNAILDWVLQTGLLATGALLAIVLLTFRQLSRKEDTDQVMPLVALIYVYVLMGTVETTFGMSFLLWIAVLLMKINETKPEQDDEEQMISGHED